MPIPAFLTPRAKITGTDTVFYAYHDTSFKDLFTCNYQSHENCGEDLALTISEAPKIFLRDSFPLNYACDLWPSKDKLSKQMSNSTNTNVKMI